MMARSGRMFKTWRELLQGSCGGALFGHHPLRRTSICYCFLAVNGNLNSHRLIHQSLTDSDQLKEEPSAATNEMLNAENMAGDTSFLKTAETATVKEGNEAEDIFRQLINDLENDLATSTKRCVAFIDKLTKAGKLRDAYCLFKALRNKGIVPDLAVYNSLLTIASKAGDFETACHIFKDLLANGRPDSTSYVAITKAFAKVGDTEIASKFGRELSEQVCSYSATVLNRLIYGFAGSGQTQSAIRLFKDMKHLKCKPDQVTYNIIIDVLGKTGQVDEAFHEFSAMKGLGHVPDIITYNTLINNYSRLGRLDLCLMLFQEMTGRGIEPDLRTYTAIIDGFGRMGHVEEAMNLFHEMRERGCKVSIYVYRSLISNLRKAGNVDLANKLSEEMQICSSKLIHPSDFKRMRK